MNRNFDSRGLKYKLQIEDKSSSVVSYLILVFWDNFFFLLVYKFSSYI